MCGIAGYIGPRIVSDNKLIEVLKLMKNRGPDHQGLKKMSLGKNKLYFLSSRLKIVDRHNRSNQPMTFEGYTIIFNGEIYNINELKKEIYSKGLKLKTNSDTETILKMYMIYGTECIRYFDGMWAFAIYDSYKELVFISRDRIGEKPLYFFKKKNEFFFGSQTLFLRTLAHNYNIINKKKIYSYLKYGFKTMEQTDESFYKNIFKLEPATNIIINKNLEIKYKKYWNPDSIEKKLSENQCSDFIRENFNKKINQICKSNLKIGLSLSGGIDSNFLLSFFVKNINKNIHTYSIIDKDKRYNEEELINYSIKKLKVKNTKIYLSNKNNYFDKLKTLIKYHDKPVSTINYFLQSYIYKKMSDDNIKICISGNGADELFAGYYHHYVLYYNSLKNKNEKESFLNLWKENILPILRSNEYKKINKKNVKSFFTFFNNSDLKNKNIIAPREKIFTKNILKNKMLNELIFQSMPLALLEDDLNAMFYSIENRSPFLNKDLVNFAQSVPTNLLMKDSYNKYLLRVSSKGLVGDRIRLNREKKGFNASFYSIFSFENKKFKEWFFDKGSPIFEFVERKKLLKYLQSNKFADLSQQGLFNVCSAKLFLENIN